MYNTVQCDEITQFRIFVAASKHNGWNMDAFSWEHDLRLRYWNIRKDDVVIDVGAGYGSYSLWALARQASLVVAFEPHIDRLYDLWNNAGVNNFYGELITLPFMAGEISNKLAAYFPEVSSGMRHNDDQEHENRLLLKIDDYVAMMRLQNVDWIKIDVEGTEEFVLDGAEKTIKEFRPNILVELHEGYNPGVEDRVVEKVYSFDDDYVSSRETGKGANDVWRFFNVFS